MWSQIGARRKLDQIKQRRISIAAVWFLRLELRSRQISRFDPASMPCPIALNQLRRGTTRALTPSLAFAPLHSVCRSLSSLLWPTNSAHDLSLVGVIRNTQFCVELCKEGKTVRSTMWYLFLVWLTSDLMDKSHVDCNFKPPDSQPI